MISGMAVFVVVAFVVMIVVALVWDNAHHNRFAEMDRTRGNLHRLNLARKVESDFYTFEDEDGSLQWRRVSAS